MRARPRTTADGSGSLLAGRRARRPPARPALRLVVRGTSMEPVLRRGDVVTVVEPDGAPPASTGDLVCFLDAADAVVTHRLLGPDVASDAAVMVTQGDGRTQPDAPVREERMLGRVTDIEPAGRLLSRRLLSLEPLAWWELAERLATAVRASRHLRRLQRRVLPLAISLRQQQRVPATGDWLSITTTAFDAREQAAGWVTTVRHSGNAGDREPLWLLFGLQVRLRYRGLGIGRRLLAAAGAAVEREGGGCLYAFVRPDNLPSAALFEAMGWRRETAPARTGPAAAVARWLCFVTRR
jgi:ribosomal protein S18 acetylase RimI-like enzyme